MRALYCVMCFLGVLSIILGVALAGFVLGWIFRILGVFIAGICVLMIIGYVMYSFVNERIFKN